MDIRQLRYFIEIVEEGTVSGAAKRLHLSQPPLSQQLKSMEEELQTKLVERNGKYLEVTEARKAARTQGLGVHYLILEAFSELHLRPNIIGECSDISLLMNLVSSGFCASIVPETLLKTHQSHASQVHKITHPAKLTSPVGLNWLTKHRLSKIAQNFIAELQ
ncbi:LysR family transcriptional regulator [Paenibacillus sp. M1]|uniref:LysR family transcriptional regulator n=1 Tax=Paenibacillus haidiansis TaxID=1574488 RepID=A0ABU7W051_9BACL